MAENVVTKKEIEDLKTAINKSFKETLRMFLKVKNGLKDIEERIDTFNKRSGQKI
jgi:predicted  nucleic acid-binding Zn-ribbon protein